MLIYVIASTYWYRVVTVLLAGLGYLEVGWVALGHVVGYGRIV
jgi:hypothetical protein